MPAIRFTLLVAVALPLARADSLDAILARMDAAAKTFQSVSATLKQSDYTAIIKDTSSPETGLLRIKRGKKGVNAIVEFTDPEPSTVVIKGAKVQMYHPKAKVEEDYDLTRYTATIDQFLLLAFGTSGSDLRRNYAVKLGGPETIDGAATTRIELAPKGDEAKKAVNKIELWIPDGKSNAIREKATKPSGDFYLANYSDIKLNVPIPDSIFNFKSPQGTRIVRPQH